MLDALRAHGLVERALVSTLFMRSLVDAARARARAAPRLVGAAREARLHALLAHEGARLRAAAATRAGGCRGIAAEHVRAGRCDALMAHHRLVTPRLVRALRRGGRRPLRVDGRRRRGDPPAGGARRHRHHHERPAAVRRAARRSRRSAAEKSAGSAPAVPGWPPVVTRRSRLTVRLVALPREVDDAAQLVRAAGRRAGGTRTSSPSRAGRPWRSRRAAARSRRRCG